MQNILFCCAEHSGRLLAVILIMHICRYINNMQQTVLIFTVYNDNFLNDATEIILCIYFSKFTKFMYILYTISFVFLL